jgi:hypothetical protein
MQPRTIEVFDGLRITTDHLDHLQGSIHSALEDFRGILGLGRVHRGFGVTPVDEHSIQVDPGLAFDSQRRRVVSDEPVKLEVPAAVATEPQFVCAGYDQGADGEVEGHLTRVWDSARIDIRPAPPGITDDAIVIAQLLPVANGGFTIEMGGIEPPPAEETEAPPPEPPVTTQAAPPRWAVRSGLFAMPDVAIDRSVLLKMATAIRDGATVGAPVAFTERLASQEVLAGVAIASLAVDAAAHLWAMTSPPDGEAPSETWRIDAAGHGQGCVAEDGAITQFGASTASWREALGNTYTRPAFADDAILAMSPYTPAAWTVGLRLALRCAPRNGDGFAIDATLEWEGQGTDAIAAALEAWTGTLRWMAEGGWSATGTTLSATHAPGE